MAKSEAAVKLFSTRKIPGGIPAAALAAAFVFVVGCASTVGVDEVEQQSNPVGGMYHELRTELDAQRNALKWYDYGDAFVKARKDGKVVMVVFETTWCKWCKKFNEEVLTDPDVKKALDEGFVCTKVDAESDDKVFHEMRQMSMVELADKYGVEGYPSIWFVDKDGGRLKLLDGFLPPGPFSAYLGYITSGSYAGQEFEDYMAGKEAAR